MPSGTELPVPLHFERFEFEGEPAVRLRVPTQQRDVETLSRQLEEALRFDTATGLLGNPGPAVTPAASRPP